MKPAPPVTSAPPISGVAAVGGGRARGDSAGRPRVDVLPLVLGAAAHPVDDLVDADGVDAAAGRDRDRAERPRDRVGGTVGMELLDPRAGRRPCVPDAGVLASASE